MKPLPFVWPFAAILPLASVCSGCAPDELDPREAEFPAPIGTTPPGELAASSAAPQAVAQQSAQSAPPEQIVVGDVDEADDSSGPAELAPGQVPPAYGDPGAGPSNGPEAPVGGGGYADTDPSALSDFRPALDPYGAWSDDPAYGTVWVPSPDVVGDDFTPYASAGHWAYDDDYAWVSDYPWGWIPFHYGRWALSPAVGWEWVPGRAYAGAWVSWRVGTGGYGYVGWAPLAPTWGWRGGAAVPVGAVSAAPYTYVATRDLFATSVGSHVLTGPPEQVAALHTRPFTAGSATPAGDASRLALAGPAPRTLGIASTSVVHTTAADRGTIQARAFARPGAAVALGARAPARAGLGARVYAGTYRPTTTLGRSGPSHFGGRLGVGFTGDPAAAAPSRGYAPYAGTRGYSGETRAMPVYRAPSSWAGGRGGGRSVASPSFGGGHAGGAATSAGNGGSGFRGGGGRAGGGRGGGRR